MTHIDAKTRSLRELLDNKKYSIEYYQREYKWGEDQIKQLLTDLEDKFYEKYQDGHERINVMNYPPYFLGSIILVEKDNETFIIDGQQRITSLTLLLIYLYRMLDDSDLKGNISRFIQSTTFGQKTFNLNIEDRKECIEKLYTEGTYLPKEDDNESVKNLVSRFEDIDEIFPEELKSKLSLFVDWLIEKLFFVEIKAQNNQDAYNIFETMNDRGLSLNPAEMLKGYILSQIQSQDKRNEANSTWKKTVHKLIQEDKKNEGAFIISWLRAKFAKDIRERKRGAKNKDFDFIGTEFHRWVRDEKDLLNLKNSNDYYNFICERHQRYAEFYLKILHYSKNFDPKYESIFYNAHNNLTLQNTVLLSPLNLDDDEEITDKKIRMVSRYLDIYISRRLINYKSIDYNTQVVTLFNLIKKIRDKNIENLYSVLIEELNNQTEEVSEIVNFKLSTQLKRKVRFLLARITYFIEKEINTVGASFGKYIRIKYEKKPYEIEHIWSHKFEDYKNIFDNEEEFREKRQSLGALILVPRGENQSFGDMPFKEKVKHYSKGNIIAKSLAKICYENNPSFTNYIKERNLPFKYYDEFDKESLKERIELYKQISESIWSQKTIEWEMNN